MAPHVKTVVLVAVVQVASAMAGDAQLTPDARGEWYCGYTAVRHTVTSADGYKTLSFRVPYNKTGRAQGRPILLQHSFGYNSESWFQLGKNSLPCLLSDAGYDVWVANARGNKYSKGHTSLNPDDDLISYWKFSFHEMAVKDLSKTIDHILTITKKSELSYVGHGMGGAMNFILLSEQPKYNAKIKGAVTFVPTCYTSPKDPDIKWVATTLNFLLGFFNFITFGLLNLFLRQHESGNIDEKFLYEALKTFEYVLNRDQYKESAERERKVFGRDIMADQSRGRLTEILGSDWMSARTFLHLCQLISSGDFRKYDYGWWDNFWYEYGSTYPPAYNLRKITTPQFIMYSSSEEFIGEKGAKRLCSKLPKNKGKCHRVRSGFRHKDFLSKRLAKQHVYDVAMRELAHYLPPIPTTPPPPENPECLVSK